MGLAKGIPFSINGEVYIMWVQFTIILALIWRYNKDIGATEKLAVMAFYSAYGFVLFGGFFKDNQWDFVTSTSTLMNVMSTAP